MKRLNTLNNCSRVCPTRFSLLAALFSIGVVGGLISCSDRDNQVRTNQAAQNEVDTRYQSDDVRASQREQNANQYKADNTGRNARDMGAAGKTADDQAMSGSDNEILAKIRREIVANDDISTYARNVKIVIEDGTVTLRGPVDSFDEKQWIERTTVANAPSFRVINELEVREQS